MYFIMSHHITMQYIRSYILTHAYIILYYIILYYIFARYSYTYLPKTYKYK